MNYGHLQVLNESGSEYTVGNVTSGQSDDLGGQNEYLDRQLAWQMNMDMRRAVLPVTIFVGFEVAIGLFGNILVLYVFICRYHVCNFRYFVLCLACVDFVSTLTTMPGEMVTQLYWYVYPAPRYCKVKSFFNMFTVSAEALCLFTIAVDRYRKICRPFEQQIKPTVAKILCLVIYMLAFVIALPVAFLWGTNTHEKYYPEFNKTINVTVCEKDQRFVETPYPVTYVVIIESIVAACLFAMLILYIFVAKKLISRRASRRMGSGSPMVKSPTNATITGSSVDQEGVVDKPEISENEYASSSEAPSRNNNNDQCENTTNEIVNHNDIEMETRVDNGLESNIAPNGTLQQQQQQQQHSGSPTRQRHNNAARVRRKTLIMFILTVVFILTTILYLTLLALIARTDDILQNMSDTEKAAYFFFFRLVFINHVINPFVYGCLDTQFSSGMRDLQQKLFTIFRR